MARIKIETSWPANTELADALRAARLAACDAMNIHVVEQETRPAVPKIVKIDPDGKHTEVDSPNDHTVDRVLVTYWDVVGGSR